MSWERRSDTGRTTAQGPERAGGAPKAFRGSCGFFQSLQGSPGYGLSFCSRESECEQPAEWTSLA